MSKDKAAALTNEQKIKVLRAAIIEGEASGPAVAFDMNDFLQTKRITLTKRNDSGQSLRNNGKS